MAGRGSGSRRRARRWGGMGLAVVAIAVTAAITAVEGAAAAAPPAGSTARVSPAPDHAQDEAAPPRGVRPLGREADQLLAEARRLSPTVCRLLAELQRSDLLVYVEFAIPRPRRTGQLALVGVGGGVRYLRIEIFGVNYVQANIPWLAHELQHAVEIASAPEVTDAAGVRRLYARIGRPSKNGPQSFETMAAIDVRNRVLAELR